MELVTAISNDLIPELINFSIIVSFKSVPILNLSSPIDISLNRYFPYKDALDIKIILSNIIEKNNYMITRIDLFKNDNYKVTKNILEKGESIYELLRKYKISSQTINDILNAVMPYYDLGQMKAGKKLEIIFDLNNDLNGISFYIDQMTKLQIALIDNSFKVFFYKKPFKIKNNLSEIFISSYLY